MTARAEWVPTSDHAPDPPARPVRREWVRTNNLTKANQLGDQGWQMHTFTVLPNGVENYLLERERQA